MFKANHGMQWKQQKNPIVPSGGHTQKVHKAQNRWNNSLSWNAIPSSFKFSMFRISSDSFILGSAT
jgi:hypothetical protein